MKKIKKIVFSLFIFLGAFSLFSCNSSEYEDIAGEYECLSVESETSNISFDDIDYSILTLAANGKYDFIFRIRAGGKFQIAGLDTATDQSDDLFLEGEYSESGMFIAEADTVTITSGMLEGIHQLKEKRVELTFKILTLNIKSLYLYNGR